MFCKEIKDVIPEKNIICFSPHYDDFLFFLGGYVFRMREAGLLDTKRFTNVHTMSRSNYQERDVQGNLDQSVKRVQYATGIRFIEDLMGLDALLGDHNYIYRAMGENESQVRGKVFNEGEGEMEMAFGSYETMDDEDWGILNRMQRAVSEYCLLPDTALVFPLCMRGHIDHFVTREGGVRAIDTPGRQATFYFAEDKPYAGTMTAEDSRINDEFIAGLGLTDLAFEFDPDRVLEYAYKYYPSQIDTIYDVGIHARSAQLKEIYGVSCNCDRIYRYIK